MADDIKCKACNDTGWRNYYTRRGQWVRRGACDCYEGSNALRRLRDEVKARNKRRYT